MIDDSSWLDLALDFMIATKLLLVRGEHLSGGLHAAEVMGLMACANRQSASSCGRELFAGETTRRLRSACALDSPYHAGLDRRPSFVCLAMLEKNLLRSIRSCCDPDVQL